MSTPSEIRNIGTTAGGARNTITQKNSTLDRSASSLDFKGNIGTAFKDASKRVRSKMNIVLRSYGDLSSRLTRLASSVDRAEREEKLKEAAAKK